MALLIGLALVSWFFVSRRVLKRIDSVAVTSRRIMAGDLSRRLEVTGTGDEFDRLANSLNAMLERIEHLLLQLRDVSDNIAHDLKTPLTRLRNRVEAALAGPPSDEAYRTALVATIEESDRLIQTFNALLMIARIEAGPPDGALTEVEAGAIVRDVVELYEPVAEEKGVELEAVTPEPITLTANRELLGQALANLVDNAIKHGLPEARSRPLRIVMSTAREGNDLVLQRRRQRRRRPGGRPRARAPALRAAGEEPLDRGQRPRAQPRQRRGRLPQRHDRTRRQHPRPGGDDAAADRRPVLIGPLSR